MDIMELSDEVNEIVDEIVNIFDKFNIDLEERELLSYPVVNAYFVGKYGKGYHKNIKISSLSDKVHLGLTRDTTSKKT